MLTIMMNLLSVIHEKFICLLSMLKMMVNGGMAIVKIIIITIGNNNNNNDNKKNAPIEA